jgi:hypothetical protein
MSIWSVAALSVALLAQQPGAAPDDDGTTVDSLVVTARPAPETKAIEAFVATVADETGSKRLGRWDRKVCPGVMGVRPQYAQILIDRIAASAVEIGLEVGEPGCKPNMLILGTAESDKLTKELVKEYPDAFAKYDDGIRASKKSFEAFMASKAPVRWWHVTRRTTADGQQYSKGDQVRVREVGRLRTGSREDFDRVIIVMDVTRMGRLRISSLADYIAMVALAQVDPKAEITGVSSVLNLFTDRAAGVEPVAGMTEWDKAYLKGLYGATRDARRGADQQEDITRSMAKDLGAPNPPPED